MDITIFILFTAIGFVCLLIAYIVRRTGLGIGIGVIGALVFAIIGITFMPPADSVTSIQVVAGNATPVSLDMGISTDNIVLIFLSLALLTFFVGVL